MWKECTIVMLRAKESHIFGEDDGTYTYHDKLVTSDGIGQPKHMYILSDEKTKKGNRGYFMCFDFENPYILNLTKGVSNEDIEHAHSRIIATTDKLLGWKNLGIDEKGQIIGNHVTKGNGCLFQRELPGIPNEFLKEYCRKGGINKVLVEYLETGTFTSSDTKLIVHDYKGAESINIKFIQPKMYTEKEVINILVKYQEKLMKTNLGRIFEIPLKEWWEQNK